MTGKSAVIFRSVPFYYIYISGFKNAKGFLWLPDVLSYRRSRKLVSCFHHADSYNKLILCDMHTHPTSLTAYASISRVGFFSDVMATTAPHSGRSAASHRVTETIANPWLTGLKKRFSGFGFTGGGGGFLGFRVMGLDVLSLLVLRIFRECQCLAGLLSWQTLLKYEA